MKIFIDGKYLSERDAKISVFDHGLLYGDGVFEGIRAYNGRVFKLKEHIDRLFYSAKAILLEIPMTRAEMMKATVETIRANMTLRVDRPLGLPAFRVTCCEFFINAHAAANASTADTRAPAVCRTAHRLAGGRAGGDDVVDQQKLTAGRRMRRVNSTRPAMLRSRAALFSPASAGQRLHPQRPAGQRCPGGPPSPAWRTGSR